MERAHRAAEPRARRPRRGPRHREGRGGHRRSCRGGARRVQRRGVAASRDGPAAADEPIDVGRQGEGRGALAGRQRAVEPRRDAPAHGAEGLRRVHLLPLGERRDPVARARLDGDDELPVPELAGRRRAAARPGQARGRSRDPQQARRALSRGVGARSTASRARRADVLDAARRRQGGDRHDPRAPHAFRRRRVTRSATSGASSTSPAASSRSPTPTTR